MGSVGGCVVEEGYYFLYGLYKMYFNKLSISCFNTLCFSFLYFDNCVKENIDN